MLGPTIKANWKWSNRRCKIEHQHSRNQQTKMDWNGCPAAWKAKVGNSVSVVKNPSEIQEPLEMWV